MKRRSQKLVGGVIIPNFMTKSDIDFCKTVLLDNGIDNIIVMRMSLGNALRKLKFKNNFVLIDKKLNDKISFDTCTWDKNSVMTSFYKNKFDLSTLQWGYQSFIDFKAVHDRENVGLHFCSKNLIDLASWNYHDWHSIYDIIYGITTSDLLKNDFVETETLK
jgi:hypothetical protein